MTGPATEPNESALPNVTVIVATYNRSDTLALALASVLTQQNVAFEVWVVGDGCTDDSEAVVRGLGDARVHWHNRAANCGTQSGPNNDGLERARGRYVAYLGHDDLWLPWHLETLVRRLEETGVDAVSSIAVTIGPNGVRGAVAPPMPGASWYGGPPSCLLHRLDVARAVGGWPDADRIAAPVDVDFWGRLHSGGARFALAPRVTTLKFPSLMFPRAYAAGDASAERGWWDRVRHDPHEAEHALLSAIAQVSAMEHTSSVPRRVGPLARALVSTALRACLRRMPFVWNAPSVTRLRVWRYQRVRARFRRARGLPATAA